MKYLVDANILSEATKPHPEAAVIDWLRQNESEIVIDPIILGEMRFGINLMPAGARRRGMERWFNEGVSKIRCLDWDAATGLRWAELVAQHRARGRSMPIKDSMIAATALQHDLTVVTRNQRDFAHAGVKILNPFVSP